MKQFIIDALERAAKTAAQTALAVIGTASVLGAVDWAVVASTAGLAAVLSVLTSIASRNVGDKNTASMVEK
ncbi:hypothetical protein FACS1894171_2500 [Clostridia bacterium]|nr:hypothetical protein FACS1894171_2500 [Clostridia bacterium]